MARRLRGESRSQAVCDLTAMGWVIFMMGNYTLRLRNTSSELPQAELNLVLVSVLLSFP